MVQGGDPTGTGRGGESIYGYALIFVFSLSFTTHVSGKLFF